MVWLIHFRIAYNERITYLNCLRDYSPSIDKLLLDLIIIVSSYPRLVDVVIIHQKILF